MAKVFKEPTSYIQRVLMRSISRMNSTHWVEDTPVVKPVPFEAGDTVSRFALNPNALTNEEISSWIVGLPKETNPEQPGSEMLEIVLLTGKRDSDGDTRTLIKVAGDNESGYYIEVRMTGHNPNIMWTDDIMCSQIGQSEPGWYTSETGSEVFEKLEQETTYECKELDAVDHETYYSVTYTIEQDSISEHFAALNGNVFGNVK